MRITKGMKGREKAKNTIGKTQGSVATMEKRKKRHWQKLEIRG